MKLNSKIYGNQLHSLYEYDNFGTFPVDFDFALISTDFTANAKRPVIPQANIQGTNGNDNLVGTSGIDQIFGLGGADTIEGLAGGDTLDGGSDTSFSEDTLSYASSNAAVTVNLQTNTVSGGHAQGDSISNFENIIGSDFNDVLTGVNGSTPQAPGTSFISGGLGSDTIDGDGKALASFAFAASGVTASLDTGTGTGGEATGDTYVNIRGFFGSDFDDIFEGSNNSSDRILAGAGDDVVIATEGGLDQYFGGTGTDTVSFENLTFNITASLDEEFAFYTGVNGIPSETDLFGFENLTGGSGDDTLEGSESANILDGGAGYDILSYANSNFEVFVNIGTNTVSRGHASGDTISNFEGIIGGDFSDTLTGSSGANQISGLGGRDIIEGLEGADTLDGGSDSSGIGDTVSYASSDAGVTVNIETNTVSGGHAQGDTISNFERIIGSDFDDIFTGNDSLNIFNNIQAGAGDDFIFATEGSLDTYLGGSGTDTVSYENLAFNITVDLDDELGSFVGTNGNASQQELFDIENLTGGSGNDTLAGDNVANIINGGAGDDLLTGGNGNDTLDGGAGTDTAIFTGSQSDFSIVDNGNGTFTVTDLNGSEGVNLLTDIEFARFGGVNGTDVALVSMTNTINGTPGNDSALNGTSDDDIINGLAGNDIIDGLAGDDVINGDDGADRLIGGLGADALNGGAGFDTADYRGAVSSIRFDVTTMGTIGEATGDTFSSIERYYLSDFNDVVTGSNANEFFYGEDGNDTINGGDGIDRIDGGAGNDILRGQGGNDLIFGSAGGDQVNGGTGFDVVSYENSVAAVTVNLATGGTSGDATGDTYFGIEVVRGSDFDDTLTGNSSVNELRGLDGDDMLDGGAGNDRLFGGAGADALNGGTGVDIAAYTDVAAGVTLDLTTGGTGGEAMGDTFSSIEWVFGSDFDDIIEGDNGNNRLEGRDGNDTLIGNDGNDRLLGGDGNDTIFGGDGVDTIFGQDGDDTLSGAGGNDFFFGGAGADSHFGGDGIDTVTYLASSTGVTLNMQTGGTGGDAAGDLYNNIERIFGSGHDDSLTGSDGNDTLIGNGGNDFLEGGLGNDSLNGGAGVDSFGYSTNSGDADVINGFTTNELIYILGNDPAFDSWAELQAVGTDAGANVIFNFGAGHTLTIVGKNLADLNASNFDFGGTAPAAAPLGGMDGFSMTEAEMMGIDVLI